MPSHTYVVKERVLRSDRAKIQYLWSNAFSHLFFTCWRHTRGEIPILVPFPYAESVAKSDRKKAIKSVAIHAHKRLGKKGEKSTLSLSSSRLLFSISCENMGNQKFSIREESDKQKSDRIFNTAAASVGGWTRLLCKCHGQWICGTCVSLFREYCDIL